VAGNGRIGKTHGPAADATADADGGLSRRMACQGTYRVCWLILARRRVDGRHGGCHVGSCGAGEQGSGELAKMFTPVSPLRGIPVGTCARPVRLGTRSQGGQHASSPMMHDASTPPDQRSVPGLGMRLAWLSCQPITLAPTYRATGRTHHGVRSADQERACR
jgi:hypothetical protein